MAELNNSSPGQWSETDAQNVSPPPDGWPSGAMLPNQVEPAGRAMMGAVKRFWDRINGTVTATGGAGAYVYTPADASFPTAYVTGETYRWRANVTAVGGDTLDVNGLGAKPIYKPGSAGPTALAPGDIQSGQMVETAYDSALNSGGGGFHLVGGTSPSAIPAGTLAPFAGAAAPAGWLLCYGQAVSRIGYAALFAAIGTNWGAGDGSTTFNLPDLRGRTVAGLDNMGGSDAGRLNDGNSSIAGARNTLGAAGGAVTHYLSWNEMPTHSHGVSDPGHAHTGVMATPGANNNSANGGSGMGGGNTAAAGTGISLQNAGSSVQHENVQPTAMANWIIKT